MCGGKIDQSRLGGIVEKICLVSQMEGRLRVRVQYHLREGHQVP